ncbi:MAG: GNAT family N-acetyltransferase [Clostridia bacterium]|nr:GNAT family N-acetyltransferase [Clostridia bacterium]
MIELIRARQQDIEPLAALFAEGFVHDPMYCHYIPYEQERQGIIFQLFRKYMTDYWDSLTVYTTADLAGGMCICPDDAKCKERVVLPAPIQKVFDRIDAVVAPQFYEHYLVLDLMAVAPQHRGKGLARAFTEQFRLEAERAGKQGIVEIYEPENIAFYEKMGFRLAHIQPVGETLSAYILEC